MADPLTKVHQGVPGLGAQAHMGVAQHHPKQDFPLFGGQWGVGYPYKLVSHEERGIGGMLAKERANYDPRTGLNRLRAGGPASGTSARQSGVQGRYAVPRCRNAGERSGTYGMAEDYRVSIVSNSNLISFQTSHAAASSGDHLQAARITSPPSRAKSRPSLRA